MSKTDHPFQPGARVAVDRSPRFSNYRSWHEDFVLKVYKNGNFVLKGEPTQQWRAWSVVRADEVPSAHRTGEGGRGFLKLWTEQADREIKADIAETKRQARWSDVSIAIDRIRYERVTDETLDLFERGIAALKPKKPTAT